MQNISRRLIYLSFLEVLLCATSLATAPGALSQEELRAATLKEISNPNAIISVSESFNETFMRNPRVLAYRTQLGITKSNYFRASEMPNPTFVVSNGMRAEQTYRVGVELEIEPPWKLAFRMLLAKNQVSQTDLEIRDNLWKLRGEIRQTYAELVMAQESLDTRIELANLASQLLLVAQKRFEVGDVPELDVLKSRLATAQADIDRNAEAQRLIKAKQQLDVMLARNYHQDISAPRLPPYNKDRQRSDLLPDFNVAAPSLDYLVDLAFKNRLELKILNQQLSVNRANMKVALGNVIPNPQLGVGNSITGNPPNGPKIIHGYYIETSWEMPVLNFQQGDISLYKATEKQLRAQVDAQKNLVTGDVTKAYNDVLTARGKIRMYEDTVLANSAEVARLSNRSYEVGQSDITASLTALQQNAQARLDYIGAVLDYQLAFNDLEQAVGIPLE
ncbi:MAG: TolC family protein [Candidatus Obscuribacterales bacterium]|nr:TolC family protein [Candidatus Obscuribacterales bacterium]